MSFKSSRCIDESWDRELVGDVFRILVKDLGLVSVRCL